VLKRSIFELRKPLGDDARRPIYLQTIPKCGYRLVAPVLPINSSEQRQSASQDGPTATSGRPTYSAQLQESSAETGRPWIGRMMSRAALVVWVLAGSLAAGWWVVSRHLFTQGAESAELVQRNLTRLTFGSGLQMDVTWSPDGRFIAYASDRAGNFDIWVQSVTGVDPVQITKSPAHDTQPDWSPDGSRLAFRSERDGGGLYVVPALGGVERQLTSIGTHPSWLRVRRYRRTHGSDAGRRMARPSLTTPSDSKWRPWRAPYRSALCLARTGSSAGGQPTFPSRRVTGSTAGSWARINHAGDLRYWHSGRQPIRRPTDQSEC
jgi:hypothetical protein